MGNGELGLTLAGGWVPKESLKLPTCSLLESSLGLMSGVCIPFKMENEECLIIFPGYDS